MQVLYEIYFLIHGVLLYVEKQTRKTRRERGLRVENICLQTLMANSSPSQESCVKMNLVECEDESC